MEIFRDTMRFTRRFLEEEKRKDGRYRFTFGWWFPRQMSLSEYRIGALEYEWVREGRSHNLPVLDDDAAAFGSFGGNFECGSFYAAV